MLVQYDKQCADKKFLKETQAAEALLEEEQKKKEEEEEEKKVKEGKEEELWLFQRGNVTWSIWYTRAPSYQGGGEGCFVFCYFKFVKLLKIQIQIKKLYLLAQF